MNASFVAASTMSIAVNGFRKAGIWPCNRHVFDGEFGRIESLQRAGDGSLPRPVPGAGDDDLPIPVPGAGDDDLPSPVPGAGDDSLPSPVSGAGDDDLPSPVPGAVDGSLPRPVSGAGDDSLLRPVPGAGDGGPSDPVQMSVDYRGQCSRSIPTKGDGRCFFRSVAISLDGSLQSAQRDQATGEIVDRLAFE